MQALLLILLYLIHSPLRRPAFLSGLGSLRTAVKSRTIQQFKFQFSIKTHQNANAPKAKRPKSEAPQNQPLIKNLPGIHDAIRVKCLFDPTHEIEVCFRHHFVHKFLLDVSNAMFTANCSAKALTQPKYLSNSFF